MGTSAQNAAATMVKEPIKKEEVQCRAPIPGVEKLGSNLGTYISIGMAVVMVAAAILLNYLFIAK